MPHEHASEPLPSAHARRPEAADSNPEHTLLALQRQAGNAAVAAAIVQRQERESERARETGAPTRDTAGASSTGASHFESDWAGRALLARWLDGEGDWDIDDPAWADYMRNHRILRARMAAYASHQIVNAAALGYDEGVIPVFEQYPMEIENGEGMIGYQYLHGTNATVGGYEITGFLRLVPGAVPDDLITAPAGVSTEPNRTSADRQVHWAFEYRWNDRIDPNARYATDVLKSTIGSVISLGAASDYRVSITWRGEGIARVDANGRIVDVYPAPASPDASLYPLR